MVPLVGGVQASIHYMDKSQKPVLFTVKTCGNLSFVSSSSRSPPPTHYRWWPHIYSEEVTRLSTLWLSLSGWLGRIWTRGAYLGACTTYPGPRPDPDLQSSVLWLLWAVWSQAWSEGPCHNMICPAEGGREQKTNLPLTSHYSIISSVRSPTPRLFELLCSLGVSFVLRASESSSWTFLDFFWDSYLTLLGLFLFALDCSLFYPFFFWRLWTLLSLSSHVWVANCYSPALDAFFWLCSLMKILSKNCL